MLEREARDRNEKLCFLGFIKPGDSFVNVEDPPFYKSLPVSWCTESVHLQFI